jgi:hypothetical protein
MALKDARADLKTWLEDMCLLKPWIDTGNPEAAAFVAAFTAARDKALLAATAYAEAVKKGDGG